MTSHNEQRQQQARRALQTLAPAQSPAPSAPAQRQARPADYDDVRAYQMPLVFDHTTPLLIGEMGRQLGKSRSASRWAVDQILSDLQNKDFQTSLVTILSNSKANGLEVALKCAEAARIKAGAHVELAGPDEDGLERLKFDEMKFEIRITSGGKTGRILVLAANPRTARGFSGHLILDEFAFHQDATAIWEAAEPIVSSRTEFLCRIFSTHNGKRTLFYQMAKGGEYPVWSIKRSEAWSMGQGDPDAWLDFITRWRALDAAACARWYASQPARFTAALTESRRLPVRPVEVLTIKSLKRRGAAITPAEAENEATDRRAYRQNYENEPGDDGGALLSMEWIVRAERGFAWTIDEGGWSGATMARLYRMAPTAELYAGMDVGRTLDLSVITVLHKDGQMRRVVAMLTMRNVDFVLQRRQVQALIEACGPRLRRLAIDRTGAGEGIADELGYPYRSLILPVHFGSTVPMDAITAAEGRKGATMRVTEVMGRALSSIFEDSHIEIPRDAQLRADLSRPGRVVSNTGMVSISAERTKADHSDRFWSLALAEYGIREGGRGTFTAESAHGTLMGGGSFGQEREHLAWGCENALSVSFDSSPVPPGGGAHHTTSPAGRAVCDLNFLEWLFFAAGRLLTFSPGALLPLFARRGASPLTPALA